MPTLVDLANDVIAKLDAIAAKVTPPVQMTVEAAATLPKPGGKQPLYILVATTKAGAAVTGLKSAQWKVDVMITGPGGGLVTIQQITDGRIPGTYLIEVIPIPAATWQAGRYVFAVSVTAGAGFALGLAAVHVS